MTPPSATTTTTRQREMDILKQKKHEKCAHTNQPTSFHIFLFSFAITAIKFVTYFNTKLGMLCINELVTVRVVTFSGLCAKIEDRNRIVKCTSISPFLITSLGRSLTRTSTHFHRHSSQAIFFVVGHRRWGRRRRRKWQRLNGN